MSAKATRIPGGIEQAALRRDPPVGVRHLHQAQRLHAEDGEDAGHQVEHDPADEGEEQGQPERQSRIALRRGNEPAARAAQHAGRHFAALLHVERERLQGAVVAGEGQQRRKTGRFGHPAGRIHGDDRAARCERDRLPTVFHQVAFGDEKVRISRFGGRLGRLNGDPHGAVEPFELRRPVDRFRQLFAGGGKAPGLRRVGVAVSHRQRQGQRRVLRHAELIVADHPARAALQPHRFARRQAGGNGNVAHQEQRLFKGVGDQIDKGKDVGNRKLERSGLESFLKFPAHRGREARVARIAPVGVPARVGHEVETERHRATAGGQRCLFCDQVDGGISGGDRRGDRRTGESQPREQRRRTDSEISH